MINLKGFLRTFPGFNSLTPWKMCIGGLFYFFILINLFHSFADLIYGIAIISSMLAIGISRKVLYEKSFIVRISSYLLIFFTFLIIGSVISAPFNDRIKSQAAYRHKLEEINNSTMNDSDTISDNEKVAIQTLVKIFNAYNEKDIEKLKALDLRARQMSDKENDLAISKGSNWVLHYVGVLSADSKSICGRFMYSYEIQRENTLGKNINVAVTNFILEKTDNGWVLASASPYKSEKKGMNKMLDTLTLQDKGKKKYGTDNLANWPGLNQ